MPHAATVFTRAHRFGRHHPHRPPAPLPLLRLLLSQTHPATCTPNIHGQVSQHHQEKRIPLPRLDLSGAFLTTARTDRSVAAPPAAHACTLSLYCQTHPSSCTDATPETYAQAAPPHRPLPRRQTPRLAPADSQVSAVRVLSSSSALPAAPLPLHVHVRHPPPEAPAPLPPSAQQRRMQLVAGHAASRVGRRRWLRRRARSRRGRWRRACSSAAPAASACITTASSVSASSSAAGRGWSGRWRCRGLGAPAEHRYDVDPEHQHRSQQQPPRIRRQAR